MLGLTSSSFMAASRGLRGQHTPSPASRDRAMLNARRASGGLLAARPQRGQCRLRIDSVFRARVRFQAADEIILGSPTIAGAQRDHAGAIEHGGIAYARRERTLGR